MSALLEDLHALDLIEKRAKAKLGWQQYAAPSELVAEITPTKQRIAYVVNALTRCAKNSERGRLSDKVVNAGARIISGSNYGDYWLREVVQRGREHDLEQYVKPLRLDQFGHVYFTKSPVRPSTLKIGFTTRIPQVRVKSLMANSGEELILLGSFVGTFMDEQIFHFLNAKQNVVGEWYFKPKFLPNVAFLEDYRCP